MHVGDTVVGRIHRDGDAWKAQASDGWRAGGSSKERLAQRLAARYRGEDDPLLKDLPGGPGSAVPDGIPSDTSAAQAVRNITAALERAKKRRTPEQLKEDGEWYDRKREELTAYAKEHGLEPGRVIGAAAAFSPGTNPKNDLKLLDWIRGIGPDGVPGAANKPKDLNPGYSYGAFKDAHDVLFGKVDPHKLLKRNVKRGEYLRSIEGDPTAWTIDVHNYRDMVGASDKDDLELGSLNAIQYKRFREAMNQAGYGPREQAIIWSDRRREGLARGNTMVPEEVLGSTPYYKTEDPQAPRRTYAEALALHKDPQWKPKLDQFRRDAKQVARRYGVRISRLEPNVGVFEGDYEPSFAIHVTGDDANVRAFNKRLGQVWGQDAVVGFHQDTEGHDREVRFTKVAKQDALFADLRKIMGDDAGASYDSDGSVRVFIGPDPELAKQVAALAKKYGTRAVRRKGTSHYLTTGGGGGRHADKLPKDW